MKKIIYSIVFAGMFFSPAFGSQKPNPLKKKIERISGKKELSDYVNAAFLQIMNVAFLSSSEIRGKYVASSKEILSNIIEDLFRKKVNVTEAVIVFMNKIIKSAEGAYGGFDSKTFKTRIIEICKKLDIDIEKEIEIGKKDFGDALLAGVLKTDFVQDQIKGYIEKRRKNLEKIIGKVLTEIERSRDHRVRNEKQILNDIVDLAVFTFKLEEKFIDIRHYKCVCSCFTRQADRICLSGLFRPHTPAFFAKKTKKKKYCGNSVASSSNSTRKERVVRKRGQNGGQNGRTKAARPGSRGRGFAGARRQKLANAISDYVEGGVRSKNAWFRAYRKHFGSVKSIPSLRSCREELKKGS